ncbi:MAG TPA: YicC family protein [Treponema sp.]|nr:YicC family protein [Treponema sp.]
MISMTGYACKEKTESDFSAAVEIRGCNSRFLEININTPPWISGLEPKIKEYISAVCGRGKVDVFIRLKEHNAPVTVLVNTEAARAYQNAIENLASSLGIGEKPGLDILLNMEGVLDVERNRDNDRYWQEIEPLLKDAARDFAAERAREGEATEKDILNSIRRIETSLEIVNSYADSLEETIKTTIKEKFSQLLGDKIDENRMLAETAALLVKYTINEEITRLGLHLAEFRAENDKNARPGKKLDFICQEINREINTIGSKSGIFEVNRAVVEMKDALENVREQLRNVE